MNIIYIRTSTEEQNPELQLKDCEALAVKLELKEYEVLQDKVTGWKELERESFDKLKRAIMKKEIKNLICWDVDRLYRNRKRLIEFFQLCKIYNCKIHSFRQEWLESLNKIQEPFNEIMFDLMLQIMGWLAEEESNKKSERVRNAMTMTDNGIYSYKGNKWGRREITQQAIDKIIQLRKEGKSMREIAKLVSWTYKGSNMKNVSLAVVHKILSGQHRKTKLTA